MSKNDHDDECNIERCTANQNFSIIPNEILQHPTMSSDAQMVLTYLLSCKDDWVIKPKNVWKAKNISRDHVYKAFEELIDLGYMLRIVTQVGNLKNSVKYKVSYFKKFLRRPESRDTEPRDTENQDGLIRNNEEKNHLEKESFDRNERPPLKKEIYECLKPLDLSEEEKISLTNFCADEDRLKDAVKVATADGFVPMNLAAVITSNYKSKRKPSKASVDVVDENKAFSARIIPIVRKHIAHLPNCSIDALSKFLEFVPGGTCIPFCLDWDKVDFKPQIKKYLQSRNLWKEEMEKLLDI